MNLFLWNNKNIKELTIAKKNTGGRDNFGKIATYHRGGGHKRRYRVINFNNSNTDKLGIIRRFEYDPNRKSYLALVCYVDGFLSYILASEGMFIGQILGSKNNYIIESGLSHKINKFPLGTYIHNIEFKKNMGGIFSRAAGTSSLILKKYGKNVLIRLRSKQLKLINNNCNASLGFVSNSDFKFNKLLKAGQSRWLGRRPHVRGVAMNPVDHPHGGGEGKTSGGRCSVSPWGILTKGYPTVRGSKRKKKKLLKF